MTFKQRCIYFFSAVLLFVLFALFEFFVLGDFVSYLSDQWSIRFVAFLVALLLINPFIVYQLLNLLPMKVKGLKVEEGLKEALRQENGYKRS